MILIISPAKSMDFESGKKVPNPTSPVFQKEAAQLVRILKEYNVEKLSELMSISSKLAQLNFERYQLWQTATQAVQGKEAAFAFKGDVYQGLQAESFSQKDLDYAQTHLRILSGLYGILRPLDHIQAHRLEMGTKLSNKRGKNLYEFWGDRITGELNKTIIEHNYKFLINLASNEYAKSVNFKKIKVRVITINFKEFRDGKFKFISFNAKKARGLISRYIIQNQLNDPEQIKLFNLEGYYFDAENSSEHDWLFVK